MPEAATEAKSLEEEIMFYFEVKLKNLVHYAGDNKLARMIEYHLGWRNESLQETRYPNMGKRSRPMLCILSYLMFSKEYQMVIPVAMAIEMIHNFSLVFDDIQDCDPIRRGRSAVWKIWGEDEAINVGCAIHSLVFKTLDEIVERIDVGKAIAISQNLSNLMLRICQGQQQDIEITKNRGLITPKQYLEMIYGKTAALFEAATFLGAYTSNTNKTNQQYTSKFGKNFGMACQIFDDMMGIWGTSEKGLDKPSSDLDNRKKTFPIIFTYSRSSNLRDIALLEKYYSNKPLDSGETADLMELLERKNAKQTTFMLGCSYLTKAVNSLKQVKGKTEIKQEIGKWIRYVVIKQLSTVNLADAMESKVKEWTIN